MRTRHTIGLVLGALALSSASLAWASAASLSLAGVKGANTDQPQAAELCPADQNFIIREDGSREACCPKDVDKIVLADGSERLCAADLDGAKPKVKGGNNFFGFLAPALAASGGAAAAAFGSNGRPASP